MGFPGGPDGKESTCNVGDLGSIPGLGRIPGEGNGYPLRYSMVYFCLTFNCQTFPGHQFYLFGFSVLYRIRINSVKIKIFSYLLPVSFFKGHCQVYRRHNLLVPPSPPSSCQFSAENTQLICPLSPPACKLLQDKTGCCLSFFPGFCIFQEFKVK